MIHNQVKSKDPIPFEQFIKYFRIKNNKMLTLYL